MINTMKILLIHGMGSLLEQRMTSRRSSRHMQQSSMEARVNISRRQSLRLYKGIRGLRLGVQIAEKYSLILHNSQDIEIKGLSGAELHFFQLPRFTALLTYNPSYGFSLDRSPDGDRTEKSSQAMRYLSFNGIMQDNRGIIVGPESRKGR